MSDMLRIVDQHISVMRRRAAPEHPDFNHEDPERLQRLYQWRQWLTDPRTNPHLYRTQ